MNRKLIFYSHRATKIDTDVRLQKLHGFINPVQQLWQNPKMDEAISSFSGFCELLGLSQVRDYLVTRHVHEIDDWGLYQLDAQGQAMQKDLEERLKVVAIPH
jgi:exportin-5